MNKISKFLPD